MNITTWHKRHRLAHPVLPADEQRELARRWQDEADAGARDRLLAHYERMIFKIAYRYNDNGVPIMDLVQEGRIGFLRALNKYDPDRARLSTYARYWIVNHISRAVTDQKPGRRRPSWFMELYHRVSREARRLEQELGRTPTIEEVAGELGDSEENVADALRIGDRDDIVSIDHNIYEGLQGSRAAGRVLEAVLADDGAAEPADVVFERDVSRLVEEAFHAVLTEREAYILRMRYGIGDEYEHTLGEAGQKLGLTRERVRQLQARAEKKLAKSLYAPLLQRFYDSY